MLETSLPLPGAAAPGAGQGPHAGASGDTAGRPAFFAMLDAALAADGGATQEGDAGGDGGSSNGGSDGPGGMMAIWNGAGEGEAPPLFDGLEQALAGSAAAGAGASPVDGEADANEAPEALPGRLAQLGAEAAADVAPQPEGGAAPGTLQGLSGESAQPGAVSGDDESVLAAAMAAIRRQSSGTAQQAPPEGAADPAARGAGDTAPRADALQALRQHTRQGGDAEEGRTQRGNETAADAPRGARQSAEQQPPATELKELMARLGQAKLQGENGERPAPPAPEKVSTNLTTLQQLGEDVFGQPRTAQPAPPPGPPGPPGGAYASATQARPDVAALAARIATEANAGSRRFEIQLDPPELGRIDVRLEIGRDGRMTTHMTVDRPETLDSLMRDARGLERALQSTGLKLEDGSVQYSLRDQSFGQQPHERGGHGGAGRHAPDGDGTSAGASEGAPDPTEPPTRRYAVGALDLRI